MASAAIPANQTPKTNYLTNGYSLKSWLLTTDHKRIAILYLISITLFFFLGGFFAMLIRLELLTPQGDLMHADISEVVAGANAWTITLQNVTLGQTFTTTVPYASTHATAEWIEETPLLIGTNAGLAALPNLTTVPFTGAKVNGASAGLQAAEKMLLTDSNGAVIGTPSDPNGTRDGFSACAWATSC